MLQAYISCDPADRALADIVAQLLARVFDGAEVFISDHGRPLSAERLNELGQRLRASHAIIPLLSPRALSQPWSLVEAGAGLRQRKTLLLLLGEVTPEALPEPLRLFPFRLVTRRGLSRLLEDVAALSRVSLPSTVTGVQEALYRLQAQLSSAAFPRARRPSGTQPSLAVRERVANLIRRARLALVTSLTSELSSSAPALVGQDLSSMRLEQLREIADYAGRPYPAFLIFTLSSLESSALDGDEASWSLFNDKGQLDRLERGVAQLERGALDGAC